MAYYANWSSKKLFMPVGGNIGEGNPTFSFSHAVIVDFENYHMILGKGNVSDVNIKSYSEQLPNNISAVTAQYYQLRINKQDWQETYKEKVMKKIATPLDLYIVDKLSNFAHPVETWESMTEDDFKSCSIGLELDLGASALQWLNVIQEKSFNGQVLDDHQISQIEAKIVDFPLMLGMAFTLQDVKDHLGKVSGNNQTGKANFNNSGYTKTANNAESKLALLKSVLHQELCDPAVTPSPDQVKLTQVANDLTMMKEDKLENLKYLLGLIFS